MSAARSQGGSPSRIHQANNALRSFDSKIKLIRDRDEAATVFHRISVAAETDREQLDPFCSNPRNEPKPAD
jgi:hypothetical protein